MSQFESVSTESAPGGLPASTAPAVATAAGGLLRLRLCWVPTARGWALLALILALAGVGFARWIHGFLAVSEPVAAELLVVEGWLSDIALQRAAREFDQGNYALLVTTGVPLDAGHFLVEHGNYAELAKQTLVKLGVEGGRIQTVPAPRVMRHRTYTTAVAFSKWLAAEGKAQAPLNLVTSGAHSRRSRMIYEQVLGRKIGVISVPEEHYDAQAWWRSSQGVKVVIEEIIGCVYSGFGY